MIRRWLVDVMHSYLYTAVLIIRQLIYMTKHEVNRFIYSYSLARGCSWDWRKSLRLYGLR